jgi:hypothetical protein
VNCQKLTNLEEASLKKWILDIDDCGLPLTQDIVRKMADLLLSERKSGPSTSIRKNWVSNSLNGMMILHQNIPANMIISVQNVRILRLSTSGLILFRTP